ncbi:hypothetical protein HNY73_002036 [Argiope bruennichi]|uniref:Uncharacterized protein n=2 Tax=Argiope bruennichi TaxID=94029 RepID=A0A8T0FSE5_ARGBR|nr:hypothetical protein HNY73_002036 [Argiope bruennichi]
MIANSEVTNFSFSSSFEESTEDKSEVDQSTMENLVRNSKTPEDIETINSFSNTANGKCSQKAMIMNSEEPISSFSSNFEVSTNKESGVDQAISENMENNSKTVEDLETTTSFIVTVNGKCSQKTMIANSEVTNFSFSSSFEESTEDKSEVDQSTMENLVRNSKTPEDIETINSFSNTANGKCSQKAMIMNSEEPISSFSSNFEVSTNKESGVDQAISENMENNSKTAKDLEKTSSFIVTVNGECSQETMIANSEVTSSSFSSSSEESTEDKSEVDQSTMEKLVRNSKTPEDIQTINSLSKNVNGKCSQETMIMNSEEPNSYFCSSFEGSSNKRNEFDQSISDNMGNNSTTPEDIKIKILLLTPSMASSSKKQ